MTGHPYMLRVVGLSSIPVPVLAMISGAAVHGEPLGVLQWLAMLCCVGALPLVLLRPSGKWQRRACAMLRPLAQWRMTATRSFLRCPIASNSPSGMSPGACRPRRHRPRADLHWLAPMCIW
jgi:hypothetical protein